jgi:hypothetical protein
VNATERREAGVVAIAVSAIVATWAAVWSRDRRPFGRGTVVDLTGESPVDKRHKRTKPVEGVVLHQMAFQRGADPRKYLGVTAHYVITTDGTIAQLHPHDAKLWASDGFNSETVAVEFAGNFQSSRGLWWRPEDYGADVPTAAQIRAGRQLMRRLHAQGITSMYAHRQATANKGNDPGPEIWMGVAEWARRVVGMDDGGPGYALADGLPIPDEWRLT